MSNAMDAMRDTAPGLRLMTIQTALVGYSEAQVSVSDEGTGIPVGKLNDVFNTFYTTKQQGTGLGLSIARTIVETYGGKIWAENRRDGGAVFHFTLPLAGSRLALALPGLASSDVVPSATSVDSGAKELRLGTLAKEHMA
jgi:signal transduction histidine kinase